MNYLPLRPLKTVGGLDFESVRNRIKIYFKIISKSLRGYKLIKYLCTRFGNESSQRDKKRGIQRDVSIGFEGVKPDTFTIY